MAEARRPIDAQRIKEIYKKLEGLTFKADSDGTRTMRQFNLSVPRIRPVYLVKDASTNNVLEEIYRNTRALESEYGGEIWKGIRTTSVEGTYKLWGTEHSVGVSDHGIYHIPSGGVEVIANRTVDFLAVVNITVMKGRRRPQLLVCPLHQLFVFQKFMCFIRLFSFPSYCCSQKHTGVGGY